MWGGFNSPVQLSLNAIPTYSSRRKPWSLAFVPNLSSLGPPQVKSRRCNRFIPGDRQPPTTNNVGKLLTPGTQSEYVKPGTSGDFFFPRPTITDLSFS